MISIDIKKFINSIIIRVSKFNHNIVNIYNDILTTFGYKLR